jgi:multidrug resistance efflux pump
MASSMAFVSEEVRPILTSFSQSAIRYIKVGDAAEMVFRSRPGKVYAGKVIRIVPGSGSAQLSASSNLITITGAPENSRWAVLLELDDPAEAAAMPQSAAASIVAIYTQKGKPVHVISKVTLRISALMGYLTSP